MRDGTATTTKPLSAKEQQVVTSIGRIVRAILIDRANPTRTKAA